jgi:hypothetical protein
LTSFQAVLRRAHLSRPTASTWQAVAGVPEIDFERFLTVARETAQTPTMVDLLKFARPTVNDDPSNPDLKTRTIKLVMSVRDYRVFKHRVDQLAASYRTDTLTDTVLALSARGHADFLRAQGQARDRSDDAARLA